MLLDPMFIIHYPGRVILLFFFIVIIKFISAGLAIRFAGYHLKMAILAGAGLAQIGEFSFILLKIGLDQNFINLSLYYLLLTSSILTMVMTPYVFNIFPILINYFSKYPFLEKILFGKADEELSLVDDQLKNHVIICGYGPIGMTIGRVLKEKAIAFVALDLNAQTVNQMKKIDVDCFYGDASSYEVLMKLHADKAKLIIITVPDSMSGEVIIKNIKNINPDCFILARSHFNKELEDYYDYGADAVVQEEFEAGITMLSKALSELRIQPAEINEEINTLRIERDDLTRMKYFGTLNFSSNLSLNRVILNLKSRVKEEAINELVRAAATSYNVNNKYELFKRVLEREAITNTSVGDGIAIPHARTNAVKDVVVCLGISKKGIDYGAIDGKPVKIIVLVGVNEASHDLYLKTLGSIASVLHNPAFVQEVLKCTDANVLIHLIQQQEKALRKQK